MRNLHGITVGAVERHIWGFISGGNGRALGIVNGVRVAHSYLVQRGQPPPMDGTFHRSARRYWHPFNRMPEEREAVLTPLCGRIRSQSRYPYLSPTGNYTWSTPRLCTDCQRLAPDTGFLDTVRRADPWYQIDATQRETTVDPVSGV